MAEVVFHLRRNHPHWDGALITLVRDRLTKTFEVGRVIDYPVLPAAGVKDTNDWHVHAAALACGADILLTCNVKDFADNDNYDVMTPDEFFVPVDDGASQAARALAHAKALALTG